MSSDVMFLCHPGSSRYKFGEEHPFNPVRLALTTDLLKAAHALTDEQIETPPTLQNDQLLSLVHRQDYVDIIKQLSKDVPDGSTISIAQQYGIDLEDTFYFPGLHEAACAIVSGSVAAAEAVMSGKVQHAYHLAGGLHHAFPERAAGFCVYNDAAIAIRHIRETYGARVLYIDTDVHHGDGVQWIFYDDPDVCTYSIHETGKFLFPGTGFVYEKGIDTGFGACFNMPVEPYTEDESWMECFTSITKVIEAFKPDIIVSQHGCDAHAFDPLSHIHCSMRIYAEMPALIHKLAHQYTQGRWVALGGGGYDLFRVVPRAWSLVWLAMTEHPLLDAIRSGSQQALPSDWREKWSAASPHPLPANWLDDAADIEAMPRRAEITAKNRQTQTIVTQDIV
jgi:acetoin utilization protein AcuC